MLAIKNILYSLLTENWWSSLSTSTNRPESLMKDKRAGALLAIERPPAGQLSVQKLAVGLSQTCSWKQIGIKIDNFFESIPCLSRYVAKRHHGLSGSLFFCRSLSWIKDSHFMCYTGMHSKALNFNIQRDLKIFISKRSLEISLRRAPWSQSAVFSSYNKRKS